MAKKQDEVQTRVRWNNDEKAKLVERGRQLMADGMTSPLEAIRAAQDVLPPERQRKLATISQADWFVNGLRKRGPLKAAGGVSAGGGGGATTVAAISKDDLRDAIVEAVSELLARLTSAIPKPAKKRGPRGAK
jgi:uncharacterized protein YoaH (UPF0181 family)